MSHSSGRVTLKKVVARFAPSSSAASYSSAGMEAMPAEKSTTKKPTVDQTSTAITHHRAMLGSPSHRGWTESRPIPRSRELIAPLSGL